MRYRLNYSGTRLCFCPPKINPDGFRLKATFHCQFYKKKIFQTRLSWGACDQPTEAFAFLCRALRELN